VRGGSSFEFDGSAACAGHSSDDFESIGLPSYQHLRPSMRRQDQYPCEFDGIEALHCCFANAVAIDIEKNVTVSAVRPTEKTCLVMMHLRSHSVLQLVYGDH
jgi:hypothetical protein